MSKQLSNYQGVSNQSRGLTGESLWLAALRIWEQLDDRLIAKAWAAKHQIACAIAECKGGDDFQRGKNAMHFGVRGHFVTTARGVCSIESYDGEHVLSPEFLAAHKLKYRPTDVSRVPLVEFLRKDDLDFLLNNMDPTCLLWERYSAANAKLHPHNKPLDVFDRIAAYTEWGMLETASNNLEDRIEILSRWCESMGFFDNVPSVESNATIIPEQEKALVRKENAFVKVLTHTPGISKLDNEEPEMLVGNQSDGVASRARTPHVTVQFRGCKADGDSRFSKLNDLFEAFFVPMDGQCGYSSIFFAG